MKILHSKAMGYLCAAVLSLGLAGAFISHSEAATKFFSLTQGQALQFRPSYITLEPGTSTSPEGVIKAAPGSTVHTTNGNIYAKTSGTLTTNTGWLPITGVYAKEATFTETTGAGVYTATIPLPAGATVQDIIINGVALWTATTSASLSVGDAGSATGFYNAVDLKATDLLAGESLSFALAGGKAGGYIANSQVSPRYSATARSIIGVVTTVGAAGSAGRTRMTVLYSFQTEQTAATKV